MSKRMSSADRTFYGPAQKITATLRAYLAKHPDRFGNVWSEEGTGIWVELKPGWCDAHGAHSVRGDNSSDLIKRLRERVQPEK